MKRFTQLMLLVVGVGSIWSGITSGMWFLTFAGLMFLVILLTTLGDSN